MIRIVDWNINGGHLVKDGGKNKNFDFFLDKIKSLNPDVLLIQEGHISGDLNQAKVFSEE